MFGGSICGGRYVAVLCRTASCSSSGVVSTSSRERFTPATAVSAQAEGPEDTGGLEDREGKVTLFTLSFLGIGIDLDQKI